MLRWLPFVVLAACPNATNTSCETCTTATPTDGPTVDTGTPGSTVTGTDTDTDVAPTTDTGTETTLPPACDTVHGLAIDSLTVTPGRLPNDRQIDVALSAASTVAVWCVADNNPADEHFLETDVPELSAALRLQGLAPSTTYTCTVAPTCPLSDQPAQVVQVTTAAGPTFPKLAVTVDPTLGMTGEYTLLGYRDGACSFFNDSWIVMYDANGAARWWYQVPDGLWVDFEALYHPEDNTIVWGGGEGPDGRAHVVDLWDGDVYVSDLPDWEDTTFHHDAKRLDDGRILTLEFRDNSVGNSTWTGWGVRLHDPVTQTVEYELDSQRYVDEGWLRSAGGLFDQDPYHANWLEWHTDTSGAEQLFLSMCFDWSIMSFDAATGDARYKLARGQGWTVLDAAGNVLDEDELPQCQHGLEVLGDDHLLVYDNGAGRGYTRATELLIDPATKQVTMNWSWTEPDWFEATLGDVDDLGNDRVLITMAHPECWSGNPGDKSEVVEVDRLTGAVASRLTFPNKAHTTYRAERFDGCDLFASVAACPERQARLDALLPVFATK